MPQRDSNPQSQWASGRRPTRGHWDRPKRRNSLSQAMYDDHLDCYNIYGDTGASCNYVFSDIHPTLHDGDRDSLRNITRHG